MTEAEYIAATNLAKLRLAHHALSEVILLRANDAAELQKARDSIRKLVDQHEVELEKMTCSS